MPAACRHPAGPDRHPPLAGARGTSGARRPPLARLAQLGFWFFLVKGLLWLAVPIAAAWLGVTL